MRDDQAHRKKNIDEDYRKMLPEKVTGKDYRKRLQEKTTGKDYRGKITASPKPLS